MKTDYTVHLRLLLCRGLGRGWVTGGGDGGGELIEGSEDRLRYEVTLGAGSDGRGRRLLLLGGADTLTSECKR